MLKFWQLLMLYFRLGVVEGEGGEGDGGADAGAGEGDGAGGGEGEDDLPGGDLDSLLEQADDALPDGEGGAKPSRENAAIREARDRAQRAEEARLRAEGERDAERRMREQSTQKPSAEAAKWAEEEAILANPETDANTKYWINANRQLRANTQVATNALNTAADIQDRNAFDRLALTNPKVHKAYEQRVEAELGKLRAAGQSAPRLALLRFMLGNDMLEGKIGRKTAKTKSADATAPRTVDRGKPPGARSDVSAKGRASEHEKRRARLENVNI